MCISNWGDPLGLLKYKWADPLGLTKTKLGDPLNLTQQRESPGSNVLVADIEKQQKREAAAAAMQSSQPKLSQSKTVLGGY